MFRAPRERIISFHTNTILREGLLCLIELNCDELNQIEFNLNESIVGITVGF